LAISKLSVSVGAQTGCMIPVGNRVIATCGAVAAPAAVAIATQSSTTSRKTARSIADLSDGLAEHILHRRTEAPLVGLEFNQLPVVDLQGLHRLPADRILQTVLCRE